MRERSQTTPRRRRGPKQPLPTRHHSSSSNEGVAGHGSESPYYTIDNTEDIYGTTLLPSQRCYVDPWDLENYDYVRKKLDVVALSEEAQLTPSPSSSPTAAPIYGYGYGQAATMPRPHTRRLSRAQCQLECCVPLRGNGLRKQSQPEQQQQLYAARSELYGMPRSTNRYDDYMATMTKQLHLDEDVMEAEEPDDLHLYGEQMQLYNGYGFSSASSTEQQHSSIGGDEMPLSLPSRRAATLQRRSVASHSSNRNNLYGYGYGTAPHPRRKHSLAKPNAATNTMPQIEFPAPPPLSLSPAYDYCNPYATVPYCSIPDCYECQQNATSLIYAAPSTLYGTLGVGRRAAQCGSPHSTGDSSLYAGIYANKFGLSKKGLLQIDYSCSWNDLDRVMGRQF